MLLITGMCLCVCVLARPHLWRSLTGLWTDPGCQVQPKALALPPRPRSMQYNWSVTANVDSEKDKINNEELSPTKGTWPFLSYCDWDRDEKHGVLRGGRQAGTSLQEAQEGFYKQGWVWQWVARQLHIKGKAGSGTGKFSSSLAVYIFSSGVAFDLWALVALSVSRSGCMVPGTGYTVNVHFLSFYYPQF